MSAFPNQTMPRIFFLAVLTVSVLTLTAGCTRHNVAPNWEETPAGEPRSLENAPVRLRADRPAHFQAPQWREEIQEAFEQWLPPGDMQQAVLRASLEPEFGAEFSEVNTPAFALMILTLGIIPYMDSTEYEHVLRLHNQENVIAEFAAPVEAQWINGWVALVWPGTQNVLLPGDEEARQTLLAYFRPLVLERLREDREHLLAHTREGDEQSYRRYLSEHGDSTMYNAALLALSGFAPRQNALDWHYENFLAYSGYREVLDEPERRWFTGPEGLTPHEMMRALEDGVSRDVLVYRLQQHYRSYMQAYMEDGEDRVWHNASDYGRSQDEILKVINNDQLLPPVYLGPEARQALVDGGLPEELADALGRVPRPGESLPDVVSRLPVEELLLEDTSGDYMNPWTRDDVLAEWVTRALDADIGRGIGGAVGAAVGREAGRQMLGNLPGGDLLGGAMGSQAGQSAGRNMAIERLGGEQYLRETSDTSFGTARAMARYLQAVYGNDPNFDDAINAASRIYPGLKEAL